MLKRNFNRLLIWATWKWAIRNGEKSLIIYELRCISPIGRAAKRNQTLNLLPGDVPLKILSLYGMTNVLFHKMLILCVNYWIWWFFTSRVLMISRYMNYQYRLKRSVLVDVPPPSHSLAFIRIKCCIYYKMILVRALTQIKEHWKIGYMKQVLLPSPPSYLNYCVCC